MIKHIKLWSIWKKRYGQSFLYNLLVLIKLRRSETFEHLIERDDLIVDLATMNVLQFGKTRR